MEERKHLTYSSALIYTIYKKKYIVEICIIQLQHITRNKSDPMNIESIVDVGEKDDNCLKTSRIWCNLF